ncbi:hypothetical protein BN946_scf184985.g13 [Trametes cinnabarina]|uniref:Uncharacterized protein n=1 Tax=Pycnoporus cinnabarinus TaxID=5643 RepID=A0A060SK33_PYCCI|nr:hypothetical protein BN946_scf184985.g13 [Trametes cinnabarina]
MPTYSKASSLSTAEHLNQAEVMNPDRFPIMHATVNHEVADDLNKLEEVALYPRKHAKVFSDEQELILDRILQTPCHDKTEAHPDAIPTYAVGVNPV